MICIRTNKNCPHNDGPIIFTHIAALPTEAQPIVSCIDRCIRLGPLISVKTIPAMSVIPDQYSEISDFIYPTYLRRDKPAQASVGLPYPRTKPLFFRHLLMIWTFFHSAMIRVPQQTSVETCSSRVSVEALDFCHMLWLVDGWTKFSGPYAHARSTYSTRCSTIKRWAIIFVKAVATLCKH